MDRARQSEAELDRFRSSADLNDPGQARLFRKLRADVAADQRDAAWFLHQLDDALEVAGMDL